MSLEAKAKSVDPPGVQSPQEQLSRFVRTPVCVISSAGGHLTEALAATAELAARPVFVTTNNEVARLRLQDERAHFIIDFHRSVPWFLVNCLQALWLVLRLRPRVVITTGAGMVVPFTLFARLFRAKVIFVETAACPGKPSETGRILAPRADQVFIQWKSQAQSFPTAHMGGPLF